MLKWKSVNTTNCSYICYNSYIASRGHWATSFIWSAIAITESRFIYKIARQHCRIHVDPVLKDSFFKDMPIYSIVKKIALPTHVAQTTPENHIWNKSESTIPDVASTQVLDFVANWFVRRRCMKYTTCNIYFIFLIFPLKMTSPFHLNKLKRCLVSNLVETGPVFLEKKPNILKV